VPATVTRAAAAGPFLPGKPEQRKVVDFWEFAGTGNTRKLARLVAPDSPLAALTRLYGAAGPLHGIGVPVGVVPTELTTHNYHQPVAGERGGTAGELRTRRGSYDYLLLWSPDRMLDEVLPYAGPWHPGHFHAHFAPVTEIPHARIDLDVVAQLLLSRTTARYGLTYAARTLAAWWRLPDPESMLARFSPAVIAASLDRAVCYWSGVPGTGYPEAAATYRADQDDVRKATPVLQQRLQLNRTRNW
jgi:hypothetical protein